MGGVRLGVFMAQTITFNGKSYSCIEDLPPEARQRYEQTLKALDANGNGIPDILELGGFPSDGMQSQMVLHSQEFHSPEEIPEDTRRLLERLTTDADQDGTPDLAEQPNLGQVVVTNKIIVNGQEFNCVDEMPADFRQLYERLTADINQDGIPDAFQGRQSVAATATSDTPVAPLTPSASVYRPEPVIQEDHPNRGWLMVTVVLLVVILIIAGVIWMR